jgi:hypothetical protein
MIEWIKNNMTLVIAIYGAILSTIGIIWNIYNSNRDKAKVKVNARFGLLTHKVTEGPFLFIEAINHGRRGVTLSSVGIRLFSGENIALMQANLPKELSEGKSHNEWIEIDKLRNEKCKFVWYKDQTGRLYKSKSINNMLKNYFNPKNRTNNVGLTIRKLGG